MNSLASSNAVPVKHHVPDVTRNKLIMDIVNAACEYRDVDWQKDEPSSVIQRLDSAVDAWREHLFSLKPPKVGKS